LKGVVSREHIHMHLNYRSSQSISEIVKKLKGRTSRKLQQEYPALRKKYLGQHFWAIGYGCWSTCNIADEMVNEYLRHHRKPTDNDNSDFILE
jgi:putative transposase